ncbi:YbaY family lipoprotein [Balneatrix alpica]|uniref:YbaY family lipoprotein n=1 Tax=Balneatrix alpica TaxID=75684 RepID=A0ABV5ZAB2_9GAMM|nr:YbaY family lipoprotein [Balneatrix alpica]
MKFHSFPVLSLMCLVLVSLAGCANRAGVGQGMQQLEVELSYRQRIAVPSDVWVEVGIYDVSSADEGIALVEQRWQPATQVPWRAQLRFDPGELIAQHDYEVQARVLSAAGELLWLNAESYPLQAPWSSRMSVLLQQAEDHSDAEGLSYQCGDGSRWLLVAEGDEIRLLRHSAETGRLLRPAAGDSDQVFVAPGARLILLEQRLHLELDGQRWSDCRLLP